MLHARLEPEFRVWMDEVPAEGRGICFGDDWKRRIAEGIHRGNHVLALLFAHSSRRPRQSAPALARGLSTLRGNAAYRLEKWGQKAISFRCNKQARRFFGCVIFIRFFTPWPLT